MIVVDAKNQILGRLATRVAKLAMNGEEIRVVNCDQVVITGRKEQVLSKLQSKVQRGIPLKGPYYPKQSDRIVRRTIRGMLPYKQERGRNAYSNVLCYVGVPADFQSVKLVSFPGADIASSKANSYVRLKDIVRQVGGTR